MLSAFRKKSIAVPEASSDTTLVVGSETSSLTSLTADQEYVFEGFGDAIDNCIVQYTPQLSLTNAIVTINLAATTSSAVTAMLSDETPVPVTQTQFIGGLLTWGLSGGAQLLEYFKKFNSLHESSKLLINGLPIEMIDRCYAVIGKEKVEVELEKPFSPDSMIKFLTANGMLRVVFTVPDTSIDLYDFGINTKRVGGTAAAATAATVATQSISIGYFLAEKFSLISDAEQAQAFQTAASITSNLPLTSVTGKLVEICNSYTKDFLRSLNTVITKLYVEPKQLHTISEEILLVASKYCNQENMLKNRKFIKSLREDLESGLSSSSRSTPRLKSSTP